MPCKISDFLLLLLISFLLTACASKRDIYYFQGANTSKSLKILSTSRAIQYETTTIQPNDILTVKVGASDVNSANPYNLSYGTTTNFASIEMLQLVSYLVTIEGTIKLPILGDIKVANKTVRELELSLVELLEEGKHLLKPFVNVRLINAKVSILGEVQKPGTYPFTEQIITIPQALGYAGDLTLNGKRTDILLIREVKGNRIMKNIDLTATDWMNDATYYVKPNDVLVVRPNFAKVKSTGIIGSLTSLLSVVSIILTATFFINN
jgi:polysaccharide export outer membrane protein